ncbi:glycosyltransferase [Pseudofrankia inefficax]|uniref:Glycosyl transferase family 2 n=1 Tax=Pseudofrankia inefficax (strain DSM 45817 / CECT 9037 / DDB 130130 / EuI1c) TaxID=298654 RepID=E3J1W7_PSEI1|nr:glycosyltransferase [Pseudofrankia inefficax]ADP82925.1 glycosyl transferase family 2 [Pseudofrankia inefficax]
MAGRGSGGSRRDGSARRAAVPAPRQGEPAGPAQPPRRRPVAQADPPEPDADPPEPDADPPEPDAGLPEPDAGLPADPGTARPARAGWHLVAGSAGLAAAATATAGLVAGAAGAVYLGWRAGHLGGTGFTGGLAFAAELALYLVVVGLAVCAARVNRGFVRRAPAPAGTLDVFVVSRGEPLSDVDRTLRTAQAITYPHRTYLLVDTRIDDAALPGGRGGAWAAAALADRRDITCLTRDDGPPSRTGLLNAALAVTDGDAVLLLDVGDTVCADAAHRVLGYLRDPQVGFVSSAWRPTASGQGPLPDRAEAALARMVAAGRDRDGAATGVGSGTLYRRVALETVGGFGVRAATEEPRTSYELHSAGWASVHHPDVVTARAARPPAVAARLTLARALDRLRILLFDNPLAKTGLTTRQRAHHLGDAALPLLAAAQIGFWLTPALMVLAGGRLSSGTDAVQWLAFGLPYLAATGLFAAAVTTEGGLVGRGLAAALAGWLAAIPLSLLALARIVVLGGRSGAAPDLARRALRSAPGQGPVRATSTAPAAATEVRAVPGKSLPAKSVAGKAVAGKGTAGKSAARKGVAEKAVVGKDTAGKGVAGKAVAGKAAAGKATTSKAALVKAVPTTAVVGKATTSKALVRAKAAPTAGLAKAVPPRVTQGTAPVKAGPAKRAPLAAVGRTGLVKGAWNRTVTAWPSGLTAHPGSALGQLTPDRWTPSLLVVSLPAVALAASVLVAAVRPDRGHLVALAWAGAVLLVAAEAVAAACALQSATVRVGGRLRATIGAAVLIAAALAVAFG